MQVQVSGKHVDVGEALRVRVSDEIALSIGKYFDRGGNAEVVVSKEGYAFRVDCSVKLASGQQLISHGSGGDAHAAFDSALAKIDTRIDGTKATAEEPLRGGHGQAGRERRHVRPSGSRGR
jgi:ribosomal subunit interface protein